MKSYITIRDAENFCSERDIITINGELYVIYLILGDRVYVRYLTTFEWLGYHARKLMKKIGIK